MWLYPFAFLFALYLICYYFVVRWKTLVFEKTNLIFRKRLRSQKILETAKEFLGNIYAGKPSPEQFQEIRQWAGRGRFTYQDLGVTPEELLQLENELL
jgi:hypothetical protein